ncbi:Glycine betaine-binding protein OpuAC precursor [Streptomyces sp. MA5143a]|nr:Glycine betaine-binding protein OpuAC precursor [Streptomyces sp. MA5143a]
MNEKEPIAVTLWSPHWAYDKYRLTKLADPRKAFGSGDGIHTLGRKCFAAEEPRVARWLKDFKLTEAQLTALEGAIEDAGKGHQEDGVRAWLKKNPGIVDKLAPVAGAH